LQLTPSSRRAASAWLGQSGGSGSATDALVDQVRAIGNRRLVQGPLSRLPPQQIEVIAHALLEVLDLPGALTPLTRRRW
jgi:mRNA-degrading endonuclease toxin of MazEF toxin-antitoxin module